MRFNPTLETVHAALGQPTDQQTELAFQTILKNRVNRGGILAAGAGMVKNGEANKGLRSRWYPETLQKRIAQVAAMRERITFIHGDGFKAIADNTNRTDAVFFIDPPYTIAGKRAGSRLYTHADIDHEELFRLAASIVGDVLLTYGNTDEVRDLAQRYGFVTWPVAMKNTHHVMMHELLIGKNLDWI